jgi:hypothetical protein
MTITIIDETPNNLYFMDDSFVGFFRKAIHSAKFERVIDSIEPLDKEHETLLKLQGYEPSTTGPHWNKWGVK